MKKTFNLKHALFFFFFLLSSAMRAENLTNLFHTLDRSIQERPVAFAAKENELLQLKEKLAELSSEEEKYYLLKELVYQYSYYQIDSAVYYSDQRIATAKLLNNASFLIESQIEKAGLLSFLRLFHESLQMLENMDYKTFPVSLRKQYLYTIVLIHHNKRRELQNTYLQDYYNSRIKAYCYEYFEIEPNQTVNHLILQAYRYRLDKNIMAATSIMHFILEKKDLTVYERVRVLFYLGDIYLETGNTDLNEAQTALAEAAILSNRYAITRNPPLMQLALLLADKNYAQAYNYLNIAIKDASFFSPDHKVGTREKTYNEIQHLYYLKIENQTKILRWVLLVIVILSLGILSMLLVFFRGNMVLKKTRKKLVQVNYKLKESNRIKELYISHFLNQYSDYIDKITEHQKYLLRLINAGHPIETIKKEALESINTKDDLNDFFINFDKLILELFPSFIEEVNQLLRPEEAYKIRNGQKNSKEKLNTELRILALLRLGICDNKKIASFFRFTVQTVYNYRSKAKSRAIDENSFEEKIKSISQY